MKKILGRWTVPLVILLIAAAIIVPRTLRGRQTAELNIFNWTEYMPQEILDAFAKEYQVRINYDTYSSNEEMLAKLTAGASGYDIIVPSDYMVSVLLKQGLLEPLNKEVLTNWDNLDPRFLNLEFDPENRYSVPYMWGTVGIAVNTEFVKDKITKWEDLWNPKYAGYIVLPDDPREIIGMGLQVIGKSRNSTDPQDLEAAKQKLSALMPAVKAFDSDSPKSLLLSGEVYLGMVWNGEAVLAALENPNILYVIPEEGGIGWIRWPFPSQQRTRICPRVYQLLAAPRNQRPAVGSVPLRKPEQGVTRLYRPEDIEQPGSLSSGVGSSKGGVAKRRGRSYGDL